MTGDGQPALTTLVRQLAEDTREVGQAEIALLKARALDIVARYKRAAIFFAIASVLAFAALIALLVGLIETLSTLIGPGLATLAVIVATLAIAGTLGMVGSRALGAKGAS